MKFIAPAIASLLLALPALAADERFDKESPGSMNGFLAAKDPTYVKECGACHFPYSPGLLPARSWVRHLDRLDRHFGENIALDAGTGDALRRYLTANGADVSAYEGSKIYMERVAPGVTPYRFQDIHRFRTMHRIVLEVIGTKPKVTVRKLTNCDACHQGAAEGSFGLQETVVPGLTPMRR